MKKYLFLIPVLFLFSTLHGQKQQDFIISMGGDSVFGKIKLFPHSNKIIFKNKETKATFYPETVLTFGIYKKANKDYVIYKPIRIYNQQKAFLKVLEEGNLKLYEETKYDVSVITELTIRTCYYLGKTNESLQLIIPEYYESVVRHYLKENPMVLNQLNQATFFDIPKLVNQFNRTATKMYFHNRGD